MSESQNVEYKESWRTEYLKWVCGFATAKMRSLLYQKNFLLPAPDRHWRRGCVTVVHSGSR